MSESGLGVFLDGSMTALRDHRDSCRGGLFPSLGLHLATISAPVTSVAEPQQYIIHVMSSISNLDK